MLLSISRGRRTRDWFEIGENFFAAHSRGGGGLGSGTGSPHLASS